MILKNECPYCHKTLILTQSTKLGNETLNHYKCGHFLVAKKDEKIRPLALVSTDGSKQAYPYQEIGVNFIVNPPEGNIPFNAIIGDEMRLGKTIQANLALASVPEMTPVLIIVGGANIWQWSREYSDWTNSLPLGVWLIENQKDFIPKGFSAYLISRDLIGRKGFCKYCKHAAERHEDSDGRCSSKKCDCRAFINADDSMVSKLLKFDFKCVVVDEAHRFKNTDSTRSRALTNFLHDISEDQYKKTIKMTCFNCNHIWDDDITIDINFTNSGQTKLHNSRHNAICPECGCQNSHSYVFQDLPKKRKCGLILLTGTSVINRADEYFIPLNLVAPEIFPSLTNFQKMWCQQDASGKYSRIKEWRLEEFRRTISPFVLRREWSDVYKDLPDLNRIFTVIQIDDENLRDAYNAVLDEIELDMIGKSQFKYFDNIGHLAKLRRICGMAKIKYASEYVSELIDMDCPWSKIAIGVHHVGVRDGIATMCRQYGVRTLSGDDSPLDKDRTMTEFATSFERVLAINMQAGGEGMDFYYVPNVLILERMWASAYENQFEARFYNPNALMVSQRLAQIWPNTEWDKPNAPRKITKVEYAIAKDTIDEFFHDMVEEKRRIFGETVANNWTAENDVMTMKQLMERAVASRL